MLQPAGRDGQALQAVRVRVSDMRVVLASADGARAAAEDSKAKCPACRTPYDESAIRFTRASLRRNCSERRPPSGRVRARAGLGSSCRVRVRVRVRAAPGAAAARQRSQAPGQRARRAAQRRTWWASPRPTAGRRPCDATNSSPGTARSPSSRRASPSPRTSPRRAASGAGRAENLTGSAYVTYAREEDAARCIRARDGSTLDGKVLRASLATSQRVPPPSDVRKPGVHAPARHRRGERQLHQGGDAGEVRRWERRAPRLRGDGSARGRLAERRAGDKNPEVQDGSGVARGRRAGAEVPGRKRVYAATTAARRAQNQNDSQNAQTKVQTQAQTQTKTGADPGGVGGAFDRGASAAPASDVGAGGNYAFWSSDSPGGGAFGGPSGGSNPDATRPRPRTRTRSPRPAAHRRLARRRPVFLDLSGARSAVYDSAVRGPRGPGRGPGRNRRERSAREGSSTSIGTRPWSGYSAEAAAARAG